MCVSTLSGALPETWREFCVFTWTTQFVVDRVPCFPKLCQICVIVFHFVSGKLEKGMFCDSTYVQNNDNKEIMITQTEFAVKITKVPMSPARKKIRDDLADKAEIRAFRGVSGSISWAGWSNTSGRVLSSVTITAHFASTNCPSGLRFEYGGASCSPAC